MIFCVSYDLRVPGRDYEDLHKSIKSFGIWWHQTESVWFVESDKAPTQIRDFLKQNIDSNDKLFVIQVARNWAGVGFSNDEYDWLKNHNYE